MKLNRISIYTTAIIITVLGILACLTLSLTAEETDNTGLVDDIKLTAKVDAFLTYSSSDGADDLFGGSLNALLAPHYKINDRALFLFIYDGSYDRRREYYADDTGYLQRSEFMSHDFTPMVRLKLGSGSRFVLTPSLFYTATFNKDAEGDSFNDGWYNYQDIGMGLDFMDKQFQLFPVPGIFKTGVQVYKRHFPNYPSLVEEDEKDYTGIITSLEYKPKATGDFSWGAEYYMLYKMLTHKKVENGEGGLNGEDQRDHMHNFIFSMGYTLTKSIALGLDLDLELYRSNQNLFESLAPGGFTSDFYSYNAYGARPGITYTFSSQPVVTRFEYSYHRTEYTGREAENSTQEKTGDKQWESRHEIATRAAYEINKNWQAQCRFRWTSVDSNNEDESVYKYEYTDTSFSVGVSYRY